MKKPESWTGLPHVLLNEILWDIEDLHYEPYESSKAECIHDILNGNASNINRGIIDAWWGYLSEESFLEMVRRHLVTAEFHVKALRNLLRKLLES